MKLSDKIRNHESFHEGNFSCNTCGSDQKELRSWVEYAEWLEGRLEGEGMWADIEKWEAQHTIPL